MSRLHSRTDARGGQVRDPYRMRGLKQPFSHTTNITLRVFAVALLIGGVVIIFAANAGLGIALIALGAALTAMVTTTRRRHGASH
jgi:NADPH:quinone reductase-like Zn-dependent oxidoreductase